MLVYGHGTLDPENLINSAESFASVQRARADGVELDVRTSADGQLMVIHDAELPDGREVRATAANDFPPEVIRLGEALDLCRGLIVNIEIKNYPSDVAYDATETITEAVIDMLAARDWVDRVLISSFGLGCIARVREIAPDVETAHLVLSRRPAAEVIQPAVEGGHRAVNPYISMVDEPFMNACRSAGLAVNVWTGFDETEDTVTALIDLGADGIITGFPGRARRVIDAARPAPGAAQ